MTEEKPLLYKIQERSCEASSNDVSDVVLEVEDMLGTQSNDWS